MGNRLETRNKIGDVGYSEWEDVDHISDGSYEIETDKAIRTIFNNHKYGVKVITVTDEDGDKWQYRVA